MFANMVYLDISLIYIIIIRQLICIIHLKDLSVNSNDILVVVKREHTLSVLWLSSQGVLRSWRNVNSSATTTMQTGKWNRLKYVLQSILQMGCSENSV